MSCEIDVCGCDECFEKEWVVRRKARNAQICDECGRVIEPEETYEAVVGIFEGERCLEKTCADCLSLRDAFFCSWQHRSIWDNFEDALAEWWDADGGELWKLEALTPKARERALAIVSRWEEDDAEDEDA